MEIAELMEWTFMEEVDIPQDIFPILAPGEQAVAAFRTLRDSAVFTTRRLVVRDVQGIIGRKVEMYSLPYSSINMWSSENAGTLDLSAEIEMWTRAGQVKIKIGRGVDIRRLDSLIAQCVFGAG